MDNQIDYQNALNGNFFSFGGATATKINAKILKGHYFRYLTSLTVSRFKWEGLPVELPQRIIEKFLLSRGKCAIVKVNKTYKVYDFTVNSFNDMGEPVEIQLVGTYYEANTNKQVTDKTFNVYEDDVVIIFDNVYRQPTLLSIVQYAEQLEKMVSMIRVNTNAQKTPVVMTGSKKQLNELKNIYKKIEDDEMVIFLTHDSRSEVGAIQTGAPLIIEDLQNQKERLLQEFFSYVGIFNANTQKNERMITDEVNSNNHAIETAQYAFLDARREALPHFKRVFGLNVTVDIRRDKNIDNQMLTGQDKEVEDNVTD